MKVYLAGASADIDVCEAFMADLRRAGCTITVDWCAAIRAEAARGNTDRTLSHLDRRHYAAADLEGVMMADVVWLLIPPAGRSIGCWVELGAALSSTTRQVVVSGDFRASIFLDLADHRFAHHGDAFAFITGLRRTS